MANSPRPGVWALERSQDFGKTFTPWQYFADTRSDCIKFFNIPADQEITEDDSVICTTEFSKIVPLENGEVKISALKKEIMSIFICSLNCSLQIYYKKNSNEKQTVWHI